jgi:membrane protease YdiL (CAAX protease family)
MTRSPSSQRPNRNSYAYLTHRPLNSLLFILPALVFFQVGTAVCGNSLLAPKDLGRLLRYFGATASYLPAMLIVAVLLIQHVVRRDRWCLEPFVLAGMLAESLGWVIPLIALSQVTGKALTQAAADGTMPQVLLAVGAGVYEEFIFRLALVSLAMLLLVDVFELPRAAVGVGAVLVAAVLFSIYHLQLSQLTDWAHFPSFALVFRMLAGVYLGGLYLLRGFGVAVGTHALFNLFVVFFAGGG